MFVDNEGFIQKSVVRTKLDIYVFILNVSLLVRGWISKTARCIFILVILALKGRQDIWDQILGNQSLSKDGQ
jgi:hypothetical protein